MAVKAHLRLNKEEKELIAGILNTDVTKLNKTLEPYATAALEEYCRMILGQKVFTRTQDIKEYRMYLLIKEVFLNRIPDDQKISDLFQTTPTESRSLVRSVASKYQYELRLAIEDTLKEVVITATASSKGSGDRIITVNSVTKIEELNKILMSIDGTLPQITKKKGTVSTYTIKASSFQKLIDYFRLDNV